MTNKLFSLTALSLNLFYQIPTMPQDNFPGKQEKPSLHESRRRFLKQSSALTAIALTPAAVVKAAARCSKKSIQISIFGTEVGGKKS